jgi:hypothetical protein
VPDTNFSYQVAIGQQMPAFTFVPEGIEIFHRLILRATLAESVNEFSLSKSCCWDQVIYSKKGFQIIICLSFSEITIALLI